MITYIYRGLKFEIHTPTGGFAEVEVLSHSGKSLKKFHTSNMPAVDNCNAILEEDAFPFSYTKRVNIAMNARRELFNEYKKYKFFSMNTRQESTNSELSPMLKKFLDLKKKLPDTLIFFRCGDFYVTYKKDAEKASKILGITLTKSSKTRDDQGKPLAMAGFPYHTLDEYLPKLIRNGCRVAIAD